MSLQNARTISGLALVLVLAMLAAVAYMGWRVLTTTWCFVRGLVLPAKNVSPLSDSKKEQTAKLANLYIYVAIPGFNFLILYCYLFFGVGKGGWQAVKVESNERAETTSAGIVFSSRYMNMHRPVAQRHSVGRRRAILR